MNSYDRLREKFSSNGLLRIVKRYPVLEDILEPYDNHNLVVVRVENLDFLSLRKPTNEELPRMIAGGLFVGDSLVARVGRNGMRTASPQLVDSDRVRPEDICPMKEAKLTLVITCLVDEFAILVCKHN